MKSKFLTLATVVFALCLTACGNSNANSSSIHEHTFNDSWNFDETYHWHDASCGHDAVSGKGMHNFGDWVIIEEATEYNNGSRYKICSVCGFKATESIDKLEHVHKPGEAKEENRNEATCTQDGSYDLVTYCYECNKELFREHKTIPALGHNYQKNTIAPTYDDDGLIIYTCSRCGDVYTEKGEDKLEHTYSSSWSHDELSHWHVCTDSGYENLKSEESEHTFEDVVTEATYEEGGYTTHTCIVCGYSYTSNETEKLYLTVIWLNYDGTELERNEKVEYGSIPNYCGQTPTKPHDSTNEFDFIGWEPEVTSITENQVYTAKFEDVERRSFDVSYNLNGGSSSLYDFFAVETKDRDDSFELPSVAPTRENYIFRGWNNIHESRVYKSGDYFDGNFDVEFWAMWELYDLCDECDGAGTLRGDDCSHCYGNGKTRCTNGCTWTNGVYTKMTCPNCKGTSGFTTINGIGGVCNSCYRNYGKIYTANEVTCSKCNGKGYTGNCSYCNGLGYNTITCPSCNGKKGRFEDKSAPILKNSDYRTIELYAKEGYEYSIGGSRWQKSPIFENLEPGTTYTFYQRRATSGNVPFGIMSNPLTTSTKVMRVNNITYVLNGGTNDPSNPSTYTVEDNIVFASPTKTGYTFLGWFDDAGNQVTSIEADTINEDITLNAHWNEGNEYTIVLYPDGGDVDETTITINYDSSYVLPTPTKSGYIFDGWYDDLTKVDNSGTWKYTTNKTFTAHWLIVTYSITYILIGGASNSNPEIYTVEDSFTLQEPTCALGTFEGWYLNDELITNIPAGTTGDLVIESRWNQTDEQKTKAQELKYATQPTISDDEKTITYGLYPQTNVNNASLISSLNSLDTPESNGWYLYKGDYYAKVVASPYDTNRKFDNDISIKKGATYWFKCEPITWNVLSNNNGDYLILSSILLDSQCFHSSSSDRKIDGKTVYASNYEYSEIREWLNDDFYNSAFALGNNHIQTTTVDNSASTANNLNDKYVCNNTEDKVFLLSFQDYLNEEYGFISEGYSYSVDTRYCKVTDYSRAKGAFYSTYSSTLFNGSYWTRSSFGVAYISWVVVSDGRITYFDVYNESNCVRPAITISFN